MDPYLSKKSVGVLKEFLEGKTLEIRKYSCDTTKVLSKKKRETYFVSSNLCIVIKVSWVFKYISAHDKFFRVDVYSTTENKKTYGNFEASQVFDLMTTGTCHTREGCVLVSVAETK